MDQFPNDANEPAPECDEFSCPCCGAGTDGSYCAPCEAAECGECDVCNSDDMLCVAHLPAGWLYLGTCIERVQLKGGAFALCSIELLRKADGERQFGRIREIFSCTVGCSLCERPVELSGREASDYAAAGGDPEKWCGVLCFGCEASCRAHAKLDKAERDWRAEGSPK